MPPVIWRCDEVTAVLLNAKFLPERILQTEAYRLLGKWGIMNYELGDLTAFALA